MRAALNFDPSDPYPLFREGEVSYADAQAHSREVDRWLGLAVEAVEEKLVRDQMQKEKVVDLRDSQHWIGLPAQALLTPYLEFRTLLEKLGPPPRSTLVDLGAGYGRLGFVMAKHWPEVRFVGYEFVKERVDEGSRRYRDLRCTQATLIRQDLADPTFSPEPASFYFLYDYGSRAAIEKTLGDLKRIAQTRPITVVGRGRLSRDMIERHTPWLSQVVPPEHSAHTSIYRTQ